MEICRHLGCLSGVARTWAVAAGVVASSLSAVATDSYGQQRIDSRGAIPSFDALPNDPLPSAEFYGWCGDRMIVEVDGRRTIYDGRSRLMPVSLSSRASLNCSGDGQRLILVDDEAGWPEKTGLVSEIDIASGTVIRKLATYQREPRPIVSVSPDFRNLASTEPLAPATSASTLNMIQLRGFNGRKISHIRWSPDSSTLFAVSQPKEDTSRQLVEIFSGQMKIGSGPIPAGFNFRNGWFVDARTLYLYLGLNRDEFGTGTIFRCLIEGWQCAPVARNVLEASAGGDGILGIVRPVGKYSNDGEWVTIPPLYLAEIRSKDLQVVARQTFRPSEKGDLSIAIAPSGTKVVLTWVNQITSGCPPEKQRHGKCYDGIVFNMPKRLK